MGQAGHLILSWLKKIKAQRKDVTYPRSPANYWQVLEQSPGPPAPRFPGPSDPSLCLAHSFPEHPSVLWDHTTLDQPCCCFLPTPRVWTRPWHGLCLPPSVPGMRHQCSSALMPMLSPIHSSRASGTPSDQRTHHHTLPQAIVPLCSCSSSSSPQSPQWL